MRAGRSKHLVRKASIAHGPLALHNCGSIATSTLPPTPSALDGESAKVQIASSVPLTSTPHLPLLAQNTFLGDYRLRQQREACTLWARGEIPSDYANPVQSKVPVLLLTGEWDPVTPPSNGETVANSRHVVVPHGAHGFFGLDGLNCIDKLIEDFIAQGSTKNLNTDCVSSIKRKGFVLE